MNTNRNKAAQSVELSLLSVSPLLFFHAFVLHNYVIIFYILYSKTPDIPSNGHRYHGNFENNYIKSGFVVIVGSVAINTSPRSIFLPMFSLG